MTEIGPHYLICIQTSKWPKMTGNFFWAILKFECISSHMSLSLSQQFWVILRYMIYRISGTSPSSVKSNDRGKFIRKILSETLLKQNLNSQNIFHLFYVS